MYDDSFEWLDEAFADCCHRLMSYWQALPPVDDRRLHDLRHEAAKRLTQSRWCLSRVMALEKEDSAGDWECDAASVSAPEIETMAEAFYYFSHRFLALCHKVPELELRGVKSRSIKLIRNNLIDHADDDGGVTTANFAWELPGGPQVKPFGRGVRPNNPGLYQHAEELIQSLRRRLDALGI